jgi:hypothetical protein
VFHDDSVTYSPIGCAEGALAERLKPGKKTGTTPGSAADVHDHMHDGIEPSGT